MAEVITKFRAETTQYDSALREAAKQLREYGTIAMAAGKDFDKFTKKQAEVARSFGNIAGAANNPKEKVKELVAAFNEAAKAYNNLTVEQQKSEWGRGLSESLQTLKVRISDAKKELYDFSSDVNSSGGLTGALDQLAGKFGLNIQQLAGWGAALGAAKVALDVSRDAFFQSESNIDEWGRTVEGAKGAYNTFLDTINSGNWSEFFSNMSTAVQGARDLYDALDRLGSIKSNNAAAIAIVQQQIAQLRLAKQQGENVDEQIKAATAKLAELQGQSVSAGKSAGTLSIGNIIRSAYDTQGTGGKISDRNINNVVNELLQDGQNAFDKYAKVYQRLEEKASDTRKVTVGTSITGASISATERYTNLDKLTEEERKQYTLSKAITEAETRIQKGISIYAQAVSEGTANAREEFKGNRYALSGSVGGKSGKSPATEATYELLEDVREEKPKVYDFMDATSNVTKSMKDLQQQMKLYKDILANATTQSEYNIGSAGVSALQRQMKLQPIALEGGITIAEAEVEMLGESLKENLEAYFKDNPIEFKSDSIATDGKDSAKTWKEAARAVQSVGQAFNQIEDPAAKVAGTLAQAIASVAMGYAEATTQAAKMGPWAWVAFAATGLAQMISTISTIKNVAHYAEGGIVGGNDYTDNTLVSVSSGELILNRSQQESIASQLQEGNAASVSSTPFVSGELIYLGLSNYLRRTGRGELLTAKG